MYDPRLAPIANPDGTISRAKVEALLNCLPALLHLPEIEAMRVLFFEDGHLPSSQDDTEHPLVGLTYEEAWLVDFVKVAGGTITREKVRHGKTVDRSVQRYRGREDVRRVRAELQTGTTGLVRPRARERRSTRRRTSSSSTTSSADPGDPDPESEPPRRRRDLRHIRHLITAYLRELGWALR